MRIVTFLFLCAAATLITTAAVAQTDAGRQFGQVTGVPKIWPTSAPDAGRDAGNPTVAPIQW